MPSTNHPIVGRVSYSVAGGGKLKLSASWIEKNVGSVLIPELKGVPTYGGRFSGNVMFYKPAIPQLKAAFAEVGRAGLQSKILFWDGSFVPRLKRGGSTPSNHTFATAFDINAEWNGFRQRPAAIGAKGDLHGIADVMRRYGFECGLDWKRTPDGMHFEINKIMASISPSTPAKPTAPPQSIIISDGTTHTRIPSELRDGGNHANVRDVLKAAGVDVIDGRWADGTPALVAKR